MNVKIFIVIVPITISRVAHIWVLFTSWSYSEVCAQSGIWDSGLEKAQNLEFIVVSSGGSTAASVMNSRKVVYNHDSLFISCSYLVSNDEEGLNLLREIWRWHNCQLTQQVERLIETCFIIIWEEKYVKPLHAVRWFIYPCTTLAWRQQYLPSGYSYS